MSSLESKKKSFKYILPFSFGGGFIGLIVGVLGFNFFTGSYLQKPYLQKEEASLVAIENIPEVKKIPLDSFLINLKDKERRKVTRLVVGLEVLISKSVDEIQKNKSKVREIIFVILSNKTYSQVSSAEGRQKIESELKRQVNLFLSKESIYRVQFREGLKFEDKRNRSSNGIKIGLSNKNTIINKVKSKRKIQSQIISRLALEFYRGHNGYNKTEMSYYETKRAAKGSLRF